MGEAKDILKKAKYQLQNDRGARLQKRFLYWPFYFLQSTLLIWRGPGGTRVKRHRQRQSLWQMLSSHEGTSITRRIWHIGIHFFSEWESANSYGRFV
jgi:hypothetical protein